MIGYAGYLLKYAFKLTYFFFSYATGFQDKQTRQLQCENTTPMRR